jgi:surfactin synthase thioesterase subunit
VLAWEQETTAGFRSRFFPGGHFYFLGEQFAGFTRQLVADTQDLVPAPA